MYSQDAKTIVRHTMESLDRRDLDGVIATCTPDAKFHGFAPKTLDVAGYRETMSKILAAFPDSRFPVEEWIVEENKVVNRHSLCGTHHGELMGISPTGRRVQIHAIAIFRLENEKIAEIWLSADFLGMMQQLGALAQPEASAE